VHAAPPRCGATRLVCIDGRSGAGKTELAGRLAPVLDAAVLHMDDLYPGWDGLAAGVDALCAGVVDPLAAGLPARYRRYDWERGRRGEDHDLGTPPVLVVEGVGAGARCAAAHASLVVWVEVPAVERFRRAMARDGEAYRPFWDRWAAQEDVHFAAEGTRERADVVVEE
jgi:hypothetical protein